MEGIRKLATAVAAIALTAACAPASQGLEDSPAPRGRQVATVEVENNNWATMNVFVVQGSSRIRLGTVTSMNRAVFRIPTSLLSTSGGMRLVADPIGSLNAYTTSPIQVSPGERIEFTIQNHLAISSVSVWGRQ